MPATGEQERSETSQMVAEMLACRDTRGPKLRDLAIRKLIEEGRR
jgi:hypothetical protein